MRAFPSKLLVFVSLVGLACSIYLLLHHININTGLQLGSSFCAISERINCDTVAMSQYSWFLGIPVAGLGLIYYWALFLFSFFSKPECDEERKNFADILLVASLLALLSTLVMASISLFVISSICIFCVVLYFNSLGLCAITYVARDKSRSVVSGLANGLKLLIGFPLRLFSGAPQTRRARIRKLNLSASFLFVTLAVVASPVYFKKGSIRGREDEVLKKAVIAGWENQPYLDIEALSFVSDVIPDFVKGSPDAKVTIHEFSDFQCPHCKRASEVLNKVFAKYGGGGIRIVFKNFPLDQSCNPNIDRPMHRLACRLAKISLCAGMQKSDFFWEMHDAIFSLWNVSEAGVDELLSTKSRIDKDRLLECANGKDVESKLASDIRLGMELKIGATPTIYLNGKRLFMVDEKTLTILIDYILKDK